MGASNGCGGSARSSLRSVAYGPKDANPYGVAIDPEDPIAARTATATLNEARRLDGQGKTAAAVRLLERAIAANKGNGSVTRLRRQLIHTLNAGGNATARATRNRRPVRRREPRRSEGDRSMHRCSQGIGPAGRRR